MTTKTALERVSDTEVRFEISVEAPVERAFQVFTKRVDAWWPREYHLVEGELTEVVLEQHVAGRWYERTADGRECDWGRVLVWNPPHQLVLTWQIGVGFVPEPYSERASRVEFTFVEDGPARTRVMLVHSALERHGDGWESMRDAISAEGGWLGLLEVYAAQVSCGSA
jgi:uncharacterized protein YndB with AHSA1/START domain